MRYYMETYIENQVEYVRIIPKTSDFADFLDYRLKVFPLYLATSETDKWFSKKLIPEIVDTNLPGSQKILTNCPLLIRENIKENNKSIEKYRNELLDLLSEWLEDSVHEFQGRWKSGEKIL